MEWVPGMPCKKCAMTVCKCLKCESCGERQPPIKMCRKCFQCRAHHDTYNNKDFPHRKCCYKYELTNATYLLNPLPRHLGVELELGYFGTIADERPHYKYFPYQLVHDGSVSESGLEMVSGKLIGDQYLYGMAQVCHDLLATKAKANNSCGFHVHVNAAEFSPLDLRRVLVVFYLMQNTLYGTLVDATRKTSEWGRTYCAPLKCDPAQLMNMGDKGEFNTWIHNWLYGVALPTKDTFEDPALYKETLRQLDAQIKHYKQTKYVNRARRWALNFHSWMMRGTLEFRLKEGTTNVDDLIMWPLWCGWFVDRIGQHTNDKQVMYWLKNPPSLLEFSQYLASGEAAMPKYIVDWVASKV